MRKTERILIELGINYREGDTVWVNSKDLVGSIKQRYPNMKVELIEKPTFEGAPDTMIIQMDKGLEVLIK